MPRRCACHLVCSIPHFGPWDSIFGATLIFCAFDMFTAPSVDVLPAASSLHHPLTIDFSLDHIPRPFSPEIDEPSSPPANPMDTPIRDNVAISLFHSFKHLRDDVTLTWPPRPSPAGPPFSSHCHQHNSSLLPLQQQNNKR